MVQGEHLAVRDIRLPRVLGALGISHSSWYARSRTKGGGVGRVAEPIDESLARGAFQRLPGVTRGGGINASRWCVKDQGWRFRIVWCKLMKRGGLLQNLRVRKAEMYQTAKLVGLLPGGCNELWQADVTYVHVPGHCWWYAVTVIDDCSRDLLANHFTWNHTAAEVNRALDIARAEVQLLHGGFEKLPLLVTDHGLSFTAGRLQEHIRGLFRHMCALRIVRRPSWACWNDLTRL